MQKIYLCGITSKEYHNIKELTDPIYKYVDGLVFVIDEKAHGDGTDNLLEERKGLGKIIRFPWMNQHDLTMNLWLHGSKVFNTGDWCIFRDSMERFNKEWAKEIRSFCEELTTQGIRTVFNYGKIFMFQWSDSLFFSGSPHFGLQNAQGQYVDLKSVLSEEKKEHTWRIGDGEPGGRPFDNKINHEAKYVWSYGRSNHLLLGMEDEIDMFQRAEMIRLQIREFARQNDFSFDIEGLKKFMEWFKEIDFANFKIWINSHRVWKNFYRYRILGEDFYEIDKSEKDWILD